MIQFHFHARYWQIAEGVVIWNIWTSEWKLTDFKPGLTKNWNLRFMQKFINIFCIPILYYFGLV